MARPAAGAPTRRGTAVLGYVGVLLVALVVLRLLLMAGGSLTPGAPAGQAPAGEGPASAEHVLWHLLLGAAVIIVAARVVGGLFQRLAQPQVVGEIVAGVVLGPSVLGAVWPEATHWLFPASALPYIDALAQIGLIFFMFLVGLELDVGLIRGRGRVAATVSQVSIVVPFLFGVALALVLFPALGSATGRFTPFALFLGASMSITAFPVLARILTERGIDKTSLGAVTLTCAAVDDVSAWCLLAVVVAVARSSDPTTALLTILLSVVFVSFMILVVRPLVARVARFHEDQGHLGGSMLALLFVGVLLSALATDRIGIHAIFGAFLFGAIMPQRSELVAEVTGKVEDFTVVFLLPLFFAYNGLRTDLGLIGGSARMWGFTLLILVVAVAGKWGGSTIAARVMGMPGREAMALGVLMNTRGLTELVILNIGLDLGVIPPELFAMLVVMALATTFMATPLLSVVLPGAEREASGETEEAPADDDPRLFRVLVPIANVAQGHRLVHTALRLVREDSERAQLVLLRVVPLPGSAYRAGPRAQESSLTRAAESLKPLVQLVEGAGHAAVPLAIPSADVAGAIVRVVDERQPDLVLMGWHRSLWGNRLLGGAVGEVLRRAKADVAVAVDPVGAGLALPSQARIVVPHGGGYHEEVGLDIALRLAKASNAEVRLVGPADDGLGARAARCYEETGVWTTPVPVAGDDPGRALVDEARDGAVVVLGVGDDWSTKAESLGGLRDVVAARTASPVVLVRRFGARRRGRAREWIVDTGEAVAVDAAGRVGDAVAERR